MLDGCVPIGHVSVRPFSNTSDTNPKSERPFCLIRLVVQCFYPGAMFLNPGLRHQGWLAHRSRHRVAARKCGPASGTDQQSTPASGGFVEHIIVCRQCRRTRKHGLVCCPSCQRPFVSRSGLYHELLVIDLCFTSMSRYIFSVTDLKVLEVRYYDYINVTSP